MFLGNASDGQRPKPRGQNEASSSSAQRSIKFKSKMFSLFIKINLTVNLLLLSLI